MLTKKNYNEIAEIINQYRKTKDTAFHDMVSLFSQYLERDNSNFNFTMFQNAIYEIEGEICPWLDGELCDSDCHHQAVPFDQDGTE